MTKNTLKVLASVATVSALAFSGANVLAATDSTDLNLEILAGALTVTAGETLNMDVLAIDNTTQETPTVQDPLPISNQDRVAVAFFDDEEVTATNAAAVDSIIVQDTRGSNAGWTLSVKFQNLASQEVGASTANDNILLANADASTKYLSLSASNVKDADSVVTQGGPANELALTAAPTFTTLSSLEAGGETDAMTLLQAATNEGSGAYELDLAIDLTIPAFGDYNIADKTIVGGQYQGTVTFDLI